MNTKKKVLAIALILIVSVSLLAAKSAPGQSRAPGLADNFYRGVTTVGSSVQIETVTETTVLGSTIETRTIGSGQEHNNRDGNLQDRSVTEVNTKVTEITTTTYEAHRGAPVSNGKDLSYTSVTSNQISSQTDTVYGDWGSAYSVPSGSK